MVLDFENYRQEQLRIIQRFTDLNARLNYLYNERERFRSLNSGYYADNTIHWFDSLIDQTKFEIMKCFSIQSENQKNHGKWEKHHIDENITLEKLFNHVSKYKIIMEKLVEINYCQEHTYIWIHTSKDSLVYLLKHLHAQGYYRSNKKPLNKEMVLIAKNTFGVDISESYVKQCNRIDLAIKKIVPVASTLV